MFERFTPEMQLAMVHDRLFTKVYNEQVVDSMNAVTAKFPDPTKLLQEMEASQSGFIKVLEKAQEEGATHANIKQALKSTQRFQLAMIGQKKLC